jgi:hypothetical protein
MKANANAEPVRAMTEAEIAAAMKEWGPLVDLPMAAYLAKVSEQRMRALWHASAFRKFLVLGRYMVRLAEVEAWISQGRHAAGRPGPGPVTPPVDAPARIVAQRTTIRGEPSEVKQERQPRSVPQ